MKNYPLQTACQYIASTAIGLVAFLAIFTPEFNISERLVDYNVHIMMMMLVLGFGSLVLGYKKIMFTSLASCMALCLFLKDASNKSLVLPTVNEQPHISLGHFNVSNVQDVSHLISTIKEIDVDILSFQELTPDWNVILQDSLNNLYPYNMSIVRIDPYGMAMYSKRSFESVDTFMWDNKPNFDTELIVEDESIHILSSYLMPSISKTADSQTKDHLDKISKVIGEKNAPVIALGDYNMVYWANPISRFRAKSQVMHSRRDASKSVLSPPIDHIFYSSTLECTKFENVRDLEENHIGILGIYQMKTQLDSPEALRTALSSLR